MKLQVIQHLSTLTDNSSGRCPSRRFSTSFRSRKTRVPSIDMGGATVLTLSDDCSGGSSSETFRMSTTLSKADIHGNLNKSNVFIHGINNKSLTQWKVMAGAWVTVLPKCAVCKPPGLSNLKLLTYFLHLHKYAAYIGNNEKVETYQQVVCGCWWFQPSTVWRPALQPCHSSPATHTKTHANAL